MFVEKGWPTLWLNCQFWRKKNFHIYIKILFEFKFWKYWFQGQMRRKLANFSWRCNSPQTPKMYLQQIKVVRNSWICWDVSQYAIFSQALINADFCYLLQFGPWYSDERISKLHYISYLGSLFCFQLEIIYKIV